MARCNTGEEVRISELRESWRSRRIRQVCQMASTYRYREIFGSPLRHFCTFTFILKSNHHNKSFRLSEQTSYSTPFHLLTSLSLTMSGFFSHSPNTL